MTAPRTDPQSTVPVEPLSLRNVLRGFIADGPLLDDAVSALSRWHDDMLDAARASQPITATLRNRIAMTIHEHWPVAHSPGCDNLQEAVDAILAALPVREDEPTGIDVEALARALAKEYGARIVGAAERVAAEYDRLTREASHVR